MVIKDRSMTETAIINLFCSFQHSNQAFRESYLKQNKPQEITSFAFSWKTFKGSPLGSHYLFEINLGKKRMRHRTTLKLNFQIDSKLIEDDIIEIQSRFMSDPPLSDNDFKNKIACSRLPSSCKGLAGLPILINYVRTIIKLHYEQKISLLSAETPSDEAIIFIVSLSYSVSLVTINHQLKRLNIKVVLR